MATTPSPIKPADVCSTVPSSTGSICEKLKALWSLSNKMCEFFTWFLNADGTLSDDAQDFFTPTSVPVGSILMWGLDTAPVGFLALNGQQVSRTTYSALFDLWGTKYGAGNGVDTFGLPDWRRRSPFGASSTNVVGAQLGDESVTLTMGNLPSEPAPIGDLATGLLVKVTGAAVSDDVFPTFGATVQTVVASRFNNHSDHAENAMGDLGDDTPVDIIHPVVSVLYIVKV